MSSLFILHYGIKGQSWGNRRYQNADGSLTAQGRLHYGYGSGQQTAMRAQQYGSPKQKIGNTSAYEAQKRGTQQNSPVYQTRKGTVPKSGIASPVKRTNTKGMRAGSAKKKTYTNTGTKKTQAFNTKAADDAYKQTSQNKKDSKDPYKTLPRDDVKGRIWINPTDGKVNSGLADLADFESEEALLKHIEDMKEDGGLGLFLGENFGIGEDNWKDSDYEKLKGQLLEQYRDVQKTLDSMDMDWQEQLEMEAPGIFDGKNPDIAKSLAKNFTKTMQSLGIDVSHMSKKQKILAKAIAARNARAEQ